MNEPTRKRSPLAFGWAFLLLCFLGMVFLAGVAMIMGGNDKEGIMETAFDGDNNVALVRLEGVIVNGAGVIEEITDWADDDDAKAIVLRIVSPGGVVGPSQEIYDAVIKARKKKPVVCSFGALAASGGYYVGAGCDKIVANPGTLTGSIGVIMAYNTTFELFEKIGLGTVVIKSGQFKDVGSPDRPMTDDERALLQSVIDSMYGQFVAAIATGRNMDEEAVRKYADGRVFSGAQALEYGFVDELGGLVEAVAVAGKLAGIEGEPEIIERVDEPNIMQQLFGEDKEFQVAIPGLIQRPVGAYYIWGAAL
jgi:protease-4